MTLGEHLAELRRRVVICAVAFAVGATVAFIVYPHILHFLQAPYCRVAGPRHCELYVTGPLDGLPCASSWPPTAGCSWRRR